MNLCIVDGQECRAPTKKRSTRHGSCTNSKHEDMTVCIVHLNTCIFDELKLTSVKGAQHTPILYKTLKIIISLYTCKCQFIHL